MKQLRTRKQYGQAMVELAVVLPFLLLLGLGVIEMGRYAYIAMLIGNAAHAGAFYGSQSNGQSTDTNGITKAADYDFAGAVATTNANGQPVSKLTVTSSVSCGCDSAGAITSQACNDATVCSTTSHWVVIVSVTATGNFDSLFNYPGIPSPLAISRTASMPVL